MKRILPTLDIIFIVIVLVSFGLMVIAIVFTFVDLGQNSVLVIPSKDSINFFLKSFAWCSPIIGSVFITFTVFYAFQALRINNENNLFNNYIVPKEERINDTLTKLKDKNKKMYHYLSCNITEIIAKIIIEEQGNHINKKKKLENYFKKYIAKEVEKFDHSGHFGDLCINNCSECPNKGQKALEQYSFIHFKMIARDLFCISVEYKDFDVDMKEIYAQKKCECSATKTT